MKRLIIAVSFLLALLSVRAQEVPPNAAPPATPKSGGADRPQPPPNIQCLNCCPVEQPAHKTKEEQAKADSLDLLYRLSLWATILGVGGALFGLFILVYQTALVRRSADAAKDAADAAKATADAVIGENRPWLFLDKIEVPYLVPAEEVPPLDQRMTYCLVSTKNYGKTPAKVTTLWARLEIGENPIKPPKDLVEEIGRTGPIPEPYIFPQGEIRTAQATLSSGFISAQIRDDVLKNKTKFVWLLGFVKYENTFEREVSSGYETRFCYLYETRLNSPQPFWTLAGPPEYNRVT